MSSSAGSTAVAGPKTEGGRTRRLDIQGMRAFAVLVVVAYHAGLPMPGGFVGVDVFFVISGFVITAMLEREWLALQRIRFGRFYARRFRRLTPALAVTVTVTVATWGAVLSPLGEQQVATKTGIGALMLGANFVIATTTGGYFDGPAESNPLLHTWSLSVEEQFYLVFPLVLASAWYISKRSPRLRSAVYWVVGAVAVASYTLAMIGPYRLTFPGADILLGFYSPFTRAWEFAVGALLAMLLARRQWLTQSAATALGLLGAALLIASLWLISESTTWPGVWTWLPVSGSLMLLAAGSVESNPVTRLLATTPMVKIGDWSYSIYLWHWPMIVLATVLFPDAPRAATWAAVLSILPALASYRWVEQPIRALNNLSPARFASLIVGVLAVPLATSLFVGFGVSNGWWSQSVKDFQDAAGPHHIGYETGCSNPVPISKRSAADCTWNADATGAPIYLVGDSNADHFDEAVIGAGEQLERPVTIATVNSCLFFPVVMERVSKPDPLYRPCASNYRGTMSWLVEQRPGTVVVANSDVLFEMSDIALGRTADDMSTDAATKVDLMQSGLTTTVERLRKAGHEVVLVPSVPHYYYEPYAYHPDQCSLARVAQGDCKASAPLSYVDKLQRPVREAIAAVAADTGADVLDLRPRLCRDDVCSTMQDGVVMYRDRAHLSVPGAKALIPEFTQAIEAASPKASGA